MDCPYVNLEGLTFQRHLKWLPSILKKEYAKTFLTMTWQKLVPLYMHIMRNGLSKRKDKTEKYF